MENGDRNEPPQKEESAFFAVFGGTLFLGLGAIILGFFLGTNLFAQIKLVINDILIGVIGTLPLALLLYWFSNTTIEPLVRFRQSQIDFFAKMEGLFTPFRIIVLSIGAGVSEELLFRGVIFVWLLKFMPFISAVILTNLIFGLLHMRTLLYAVIAGLVGVYLTVLYVVTGNLLTPIVTHILYDAVALEYTRRAIAGRN
jgi:membrane protease YdiL (CAAX protease family)